MKGIAILFVALVLFPGCKKDDNPVVEPEPIKTMPTVSIINVADNEEVTGQKTIEIEATDDKGVVKVELFIDNKLVDSLFVKPYQYVFNPDQYLDSSKHTIYAKAYDGDGNSTASKLITIKSCQFYPPINLQIAYITEDAVTLTWGNINPKAEKIFFELSENNYSNFKLIDSAVISTGTKVISGAFKSSTYYYFKIYSKSNTSTSGFQQMMMNYPFEAPTKLTALKKSATSYELSWQLSNPYAKWIIVEKSRNATSDFVVVDSISTSSSTIVVNDPDFQFNQVYFRIRATSKYNKSAYTASVGMVKTFTRGPVRIYETNGATAVRPSGLNLRNGFRGFSLTGTDRDSVDLLYSSNGFLLISAYANGGMARKTYFKLPSASGVSNLFDGASSPTFVDTWGNAIADRDSTTYYFIYDNDKHYSKLKVVNYGGSGGLGSPAWVEVKWIYNNVVDDVRFD